MGSAVTAGETSEQTAEIRELRREIRELRLANEVLRRASDFFVAELDRQARLYPN